MGIIGPINNLGKWFLLDSLSLFIGIAIVFFSIIIFIYSLGFISKKRGLYYLWFILTLLASLLAVFANHILILLIAWGFLGLSLFQLINLYSDDSISKIAKKAFIIVGGSDSFLILGIFLYGFFADTVFLKRNVPLEIHNMWLLFAFLFIASAAFAKAGCMPFHSWIPDAAKKAPLPVVAYLPASLDKLLGIYLLVRIVKDTFILNDVARAVLIILGALTVICSVMMALIQHDIKGLLGYHAVSQVGYMVLGIGVATPLGLAAGLFHMLNNAIYKTCLFLGAGNIEKQCGVQEINKLGGLGKFMPWTFLTMLVAALSISGIPMFNGFISKWMVYQSLIEFMNSTSTLWLKVVISLSLVLALAGSALTLASFLKLIGAIFLGKEPQRVKEVGKLLLIPVVILSLLCILIGIFPFISVGRFISTAVGGAEIIGLWQMSSSLILILLGILLGLFVYFYQRTRIRQSDIFIGGETYENIPPRLEDFYKDVSDLKGFSLIYRLAEKKYFDIYNIGIRVVFSFVNGLRYLHNGVLPTYLVWSLLGILFLFYLFMR